MNERLVQLLNMYISHRFPEMAGVQPTVRRLPMPPHLRGFHVPSFLLIYHRMGKGPGGRRIPRWIRVHMNVLGHISKITTSR